MRIIAIYKECSTSRVIVRLYLFSTTMEVLTTIIQILIITTAQAFHIGTSDNINCKTSRVQCLSNSTYTTCINIGELTILLNVIFKCPEDFVCNEETRVPCVLEKDLPTTTDLPSTTTITTTTRKIVPRPTGKPNCTEPGLWPAPDCNQYYECVKTQFLWIVTYNIVLHSCQDGYYFDTGRLECVPAKESDCQQ